MKHGTYQQNDCEETPPSPAPPAKGGESEVPPPGGGGWVGVKRICSREPFPGKTKETVPEKGLRATVFRVLSIEGRTATE